ncbi:hypothetical protein CLM85_00790 [Streptomyces albidoflavus]|nr:hypothetical protein CLM85_00790 [Streptomyces albidoflavus]
MARTGVPGATVTVTRGDRVVLAAGYGHTAAGEPMTARTPVPVASLSKAMTALAVTTLAEEGRVDLDAPVRDQLPEFAPDDARAARITPRQLLDQTSGMADSTHPDLALPQPSTLKAAVAALHGTRLATDPGTAWHYHNTNYAVAARLVETATGTPYAEHLRRSLFAPLGMTGTGTVDTTADMPDGARGYVRAYGRTIERAHPRLFTAGGFGVVSTAGDLGKWLIAQHTEGTSATGRRAAPAGRALPPDQAADAPDPRRWKALVFIALAQLMVVLDATIVNIALPSAQRDLGITDGNRQWVITAYALAFGGLLLFGGRISDLWGRKRTFLTGLVGFALASALGGAADGQALMLGARALQGVFGALLAPAALSLLAVTFTDVRERAKAFGVYGAIAGAGGAIGLLLGGVLTEYLNWRWTFFVNIPIAAIAFTGAYLLIREPARARNRAPLDIPGVVLSTTGLVSLVHGFTRAETHGWSDSLTVGSFVAAGVLLLAFVLVERRVAAPLLPLRVLMDRNRGGVYLSLGLAVIAMFGLFLFLTYYLQVVQGYSPVRTGFAFLPMSAGMIIGSTQIGARLMTRVPPRLLLGPGFLAAAIGMLLLTRLEVGSSYAAVVLPAQVLLGLGLGTAFMPAMSMATHGIAPRDAGVASAMVNTSQQVGGAIGTALLNTIAASATASYLATHAATGEAVRRVQAEAMVAGFTQAIWWAVGILAVAAALAFTLVTAGRPGGPAAASGDARDKGAGEQAEAAPVAVHLG